MSARRQPLVVDGHPIPNVRVRRTPEGPRFDAVIRLGGDKQTTRRLEAASVEDALDELSELGIVYATHGLVESICAAVRGVVREELRVTDVNHALELELQPAELGLETVVYIQDAPLDKPDSDARRAFREAFARRGPHS